MTAALRTQLSAADQGRRARRPLPPGAVAATVLAGQAMAAMDAAIVNVAGPAIQHDLGLSGPALQLVVYSYLLVYAVALVTGARVGARRGYGRVYLYGVALFTGSSLACGLATTPAVLVAARAAQGAGAAMLVPQVLSLLQTTFQGARLRRAMSLYGLVLAVGVAAGQIVGGVLVTADIFGAGWRPVFLVNVPVGLAVLAVSAGRLPAAATSRSPLDLAGAALLGTGILALIIPLTFGADAGWPDWTWPTAAAGVVAIAVFARHESSRARGGRIPLIDPAVLTRPGVRSGLAGIFSLHASYGGLLFTTALYLQHRLGESPLASGLTFAGYAAGFATASLTWTRLPSSWQLWLPHAAFATFTTSAGLLAWLVGSGGWPWPATALLALAGSAHGAGFATLAHRASASVGVGHTASFSGMLATVAQLAIVTGVAVAGTVYLATGAASPIPPMSMVAITLAAAQATVGAAALAGRRGRRRTV